MKTSSSISFWANGPLKASVYKSGNTFALEIGDNNTETLGTDKVGIFVDSKYAKHLSVAVLAFNEAWKTVEKEMELTHE